MKNIIYIILISNLLISCFKTEEIITWDIEEHSDMLTVESIITNEFEVQTVKLVLSNSYFDTSAVRSVNNASVVVDDGTNSINFYESNETPGLYESEYPFACEELKTYTLTITTQEPIYGMTEYTATSQMPDGLEMDSIECDIYKMPEFDFEEEEDTTLLIIFYFGEQPLQAENYYFTKTFINGKPIETNPKEYDYFTTSFENAGYTNIYGCQKNVIQDDTVTFILYTVERQYFKYMEALHKIDETGNPMNLSGPPANAEGNINNGAGLGYFLAAYVSEKTSLAIDKR